ncbi:MAG: hypothetical protein Fur0010_25450 [Bdellovibrio sp.]
MQSTMGGLQNKLMGRSKRILGDAVVSIDSKNADAYLELAKRFQITAIPEFEIELLLRHKGLIRPVIVHALDPEVPYLPGPLKDLPFKELLISRDLAHQLDVSELDQVQLISPAHVDSFLGDVPRFISLYIDTLFMTDVPEVDIAHIYVRHKSVANLVRFYKYNRIRLWGQITSEFLSELKKIDPNSSVKTWEEVNQTLHWALRLESGMMIFLFSSMTLLVSLSITTGLLIFFNKVKGDLAAMWILGRSERDIILGARNFLFSINIFASGLGLLLGLLALYLLKKYGTEIMPDVFVDRKIPVLVTVKGLFISFLIPVLIGSLFSWWSLRQFKREVNFLSYIRGY